MESNLSQLSSLSDDGNQLYIQPHYKETYRLAIYALLCGGREAYEEFLRAEQISNFLSEQEILFIQENAELPAEEDECEANRPREAANPSTYFPLESDEEVPDLELGWPEVSPDAADTSISLLFNPPRVDTPTIKEVIRKQLQEARQVRAENKNYIMHLAPSWRPHGLKHGTSPSMPIYETPRNICNTHGWGQKASHKTFALCCVFSCGGAVAIR